MTESWNDQLNAPPLSIKQIDQCVGAIIDQYRRVVGEGYFFESGMSFSRLFEEVIYPDYEIDLVDGIDLGVDSNGKKLLGMFNVEDNTVFIDHEIGPDSGDPRRTFTLHHEMIGHAVLQGAWIRKELRRLERSPFLTTTAESLTQAVENRMERQANLAAGLTAAPMELISHSIYNTFGLKKSLVFLESTRGYWLNIHGVSRQYSVEDFGDFCRLIAKHIQGRFDGLSAQSLSYRVAQCRLLSDRSGPALRLYRAIG